MDALVKALAPAFAAGFALQRLMELLNPLWDQFGKNAMFDRKREWFMNAFSLMGGLVLAFGVPLTVLGPLGYASGSLADRLITALVISAGTEGVNTILKFLGYAKAEKKNEAMRARRS